jgi:hypothetical protein
MMIHYPWIRQAAFCLALAGCHGPAETAASTPSADTFRAERFELRIGDTTEEVIGASVKKAFFREAKVLPLLGRLFLDDEYQAAGPGVVVIGASLWQSQFDGNPTAIGRTLAVNQRPCTIIGILPKTFQFPGGAELWMPQNQ